MFAYNPGVADRSGEILGQGASQAAQINAQMLAQFGQDVGGMMTTFAEAYKQKEQDKSDAKIYGQLLKFIGPAFGQEGDAILAEYNALESDRDKANYGRTISQLLGPASNALMARRNAGIRENQQALTAAMPNLRAQQNAAAQVAAGQGRVTTLPSNINPDAIP
jgi:hypothetical protein